MSLNSTTTRIIEQVSAELLDENGQMSVEVLDYGSASGETYETPTNISNPFNFDPRHFLPNCQNHLPHPVHE